MARSRYAGLGGDFDHLRRIALAGKAIAFSPRLSVLKFPSAAFASYSLSGALPQTSWLRRLRQDPLEVEREVLTDMATLYERRWRAEQVPTIRRALRMLRHAAMPRSGRLRYPLQS